MRGSKFGSFYKANKTHSIEVVFTGEWCGACMDLGMPLSHQHSMYFIVCVYAYVDVSGKKSHTFSRSTKEICTSKSATNKL